MKYLFNITITGRPVVLVHPGHADIIQDEKYVSAQYILRIEIGVPV